MKNIVVKQPGLYRFIHDKDDEIFFLFFAIKKGRRPFEYETRGSYTSCREEFSVPTDFLISADYNQSRRIVSLVRNIECSLNIAKSKFRRGILKSVQDCPILAVFPSSWWLKNVRNFSVLTALVKCAYRYPRQAIAKWLGRSEYFNKFTIDCLLKNPKKIKSNNNTEQQLVEWSESWT